jgi:hypothetical protein
MAPVAGLKRVLVGNIITIEVLILKNNKIFPFSPDFPFISTIYFVLYGPFQKNTPAGHKKPLPGLIHNVFRSKGVKSKNRRF